MKEEKMKRVHLIVLCLAFLLIYKAPVFSHCEIPCGIYNDEMRFELIMEHVQTIEKAVNRVIKLSKDNWKLHELSDSPVPVNNNQLVRWIVNKENHAEEIQHIVSQYFLIQRIKLNDRKEPEAQKKYINQLCLCHKILIYAMKTKQSLDLSNVKELKKNVMEFKKIYFDSKEEK
jgi:nickel superoxide dismutase